MRFTLPTASILLATVALFSKSVFSHPIHSRSLDVESRDIDLTSDELFVRVPDAVIASRYYSDYEDDVWQRAPAAPYNAPKARVKVTAAAQQARKGAMQAKTNAATAKNKDKALNHKASKNLPGHPASQSVKMPKPNMVKGQAQSAKAQTKQAAANARTAQRKADGRAKFAGAKAGHAATTGLPGRKEKFTANGVTATGRDVRTANFNSHHFAPNAGVKGPKKGPGPVAPTNFQNREQGPAGAKTRPLPGGAMTNGKEFPVVPGKKNGYQGGNDKGAMRLVTENNKFKGVIAHDSTKKKGDPGHNDHFQVPSTR